MELSSPTFAADQLIPTEFTARGVGTAPPLVIANIPPGTVALALIVHDPDAPRGDFTHWTVWNIPPTTTLLSQNALPKGVCQGTNDIGTVGYTPPAPPSGTHHYLFDLYALDRLLDVPMGAPLPDLHAALLGHILSQAQLVGTVTAS